MDYYEIKKVVPVESTLCIEECEKLLISEKFCLGILNENREIISYVLKEDIEKLLKFNIFSQSVEFIARKADIVDININDIQNIIDEYTVPGLNSAVFVGKSRKFVDYLVINTNYNKNCDVFLNVEYQRNISEKVQRALTLCADVADKYSVPIFLIGGVVRDIIIDKEIFDVDITVQANAIEFSKLLRKELPFICKIKETHEEFKTAKIIVKIDDEEIEFDVASTRKEVYPSPASLPKIVEIGCDIYDDIFRRDFTINSMAMMLNKERFCCLVDPFRGRDDLNNKVLRILHPLSFIDDPTRIIRGLKFAIRFDLTYDELSFKLKTYCLNSGMFDNIGGERIKSEIKQTFNLDRPVCLEQFIKNKDYLLINKSINKIDSVDKIANKCHKVIQKYKKYISSENLIWLIYLGTIVLDLPERDIAKLAEKLHVSGLETEILLGAKSIFNKINLIKDAISRFEIYESLESYFIESILICFILDASNVIEANVDLYITELQHIKIFTTGKDLIDAGVAPGPVFGGILKELLEAKINREIHTQEDEKKYLSNLLNHKNK